MHQPEAFGNSSWLPSTIPSLTLRGVQGVEDSENIEIPHLQFDPLCKTFSITTPTVSFSESPLRALFIRIVVPAEA
jgi:hypothetical protein